MNKLLAELICTRISHDVIGNVGAVANAVELLEEGDMEFLDDIKSILKVSSGVLTSRLKFFRMIFGVDSDQLNHNDIVEQTLGAYLQTVGGKNPPQLDFSLTTTKYNKAVMLAAMCVADVMIKGGTIQIYEQSGKVHINTSPETKTSAERIAHESDLLNGKVATPIAQDAPVLSLLDVCQKKGFGLAFSTNPCFHFVLE